MMIKKSSLRIASHKDPQDRIHCHILSRKYVGQDLDCKTIVRILFYLFGFFLLSLCRYENVRGDTSVQLFSNGCQFTVTGKTLKISKEGRELMNLPLVPYVEDETFQMGPWKSIGTDHYRMKLTGLGSVHLALREGYVCYWIETKRKYFPRLTYFPNSQPTSSRWHTFLSDELDRTWTVDENVDVPLSCSYFGLHVDKADGAGMTDPGDNPPTWIWNIPPRVFAVELANGWMGFSIPGPLSVAVTRLTMQRGQFNLIFEELRPTAKEWGPPRVYLIPGLADPYDALDQHRLISDACGLTNRNKGPHPEWWSYPSYKAWDEVFRLNKGAILHDDEGNFTSYFTTENWLHWIDYVANYSGLKGRMNLQVDQIYVHGYGSKKVISTLGGNEGFRKTIDELRQRGMHTGCYIHLFQLDPAVTDFPKLHPEAICTPKDSSISFQSGVPLGGKSLIYVDWTHPLGRKYMLSMVEWILSDKPGCLNADWLLINNNLCVDPRKYNFYDPDWGTGDLMQMKVTKMVYEYAKKIKPDCLVRRQSPGDPFMQPYCDEANLCEEWNGNTRAWYKRAHIATRILEQCILHTDAWFVTLTKLTEYYFALATICPPEIESVRHAIHPYMYYREMRPKDYRRIRAGVQTYMNAPVLRSDICRVNYHEPDKLEIWRKRTTGPLSGWYAAIALSKRTFVTYSDTEARVASSRERRVAVPLPPKALLSAVIAVPHEGEPFDYPFEHIQLNGQQAIRLWIPDAGEKVMYISIKYSLK